MTSTTTASTWSWLPGHGDTVWSHSWTLELWWPREQWLSPARLSWPARGVDVILPVDPAALEAVAATCPEPPDVPVEAHHPGFDDLPTGPPLGVQAHEPGQIADSARRAPSGGTQHWPHHDPEPNPGSNDSGPDR